ncbi:MAG TPA: hypothetical protein VFI24_01430 [Pyrinomonadaceae bacterium]|nr:hypothetical protein [Pyrinomonadaceae bacterium]
MSNSKRLYQLLLLAYPRDFRVAYGPEMTQLFRDCYRDTHSRGLLTMADFWLRVIIDVMRTAPLERFETLRKGETMKNLKRDAMGLVACLIITLVAFTLLGYGRKHEVGSILMIGHALDAIVTAGVIGNIVIFALMIAKGLSSFRTALWSLAIVNGALLLLVTLIGSRVDPQFSFATIFVAYLASFIFWVAIHWIWSQIRTNPQMTQID